MVEIIARTRLIGSNTQRPAACQTLTLPVFGRQKAAKWKAKWGAEICSFHQLYYTKTFHCRLQGTTHMGIHGTCMTRPWGKWIPGYTDAFLVGGTGIFRPHLLRQVRSLLKALRPTDLRSARTPRMPCSRLRNWEQASKSAQVRTPYFWFFFLFISKMFWFEKVQTHECNLGVGKDRWTTSTYTKLL